MGSGNKVQRQKKGLWSLGERKQEHIALWGRRGERVWLLRAGILGETPRADFKRIFIRFPSFRVVVSIDWLVLQ